ncbi:hypothetical protein [Paenibacillus aquistagni]|uniref:Uncharacterized protein n=1 Tax=Paenibacillus aquistagni TaxID=1852522 RepID=A0A1X7ISB1_9BACL|nr:hypothetical protein [Paenibacillus aquistagni]NMM51100.1 hypothetical protein [Paenibacillus aquistagni]SMG18067.1 hypothetical protein SAMN06295960_0763 [Paenibacillus aquistagni]
MDLLIIIIGAFFMILVLSNQYVALKKISQLQQSLEETNHALNLALADNDDTLIKRIH